jgi:hypothetical protein
MLFRQVGLKQEDEGPKLLRIQQVVHGNKLLGSARKLGKLPGEPAGSR